MLHFSKTAGYAIHALSCIGAAQPKASLIRDVAECTGLRKPYLAKIINQLVHHGLVLAKRGYRGGLLLSRPPEEITLLQIVEGIEGDAHVGPCIFGLGECPAHGQCPAHALWGAMGTKIESALKAISLSEVMACTPRCPKPRRRTSNHVGRPKLEDRLFCCRRRERQTVA